MACFPQTGWRPRADQLQRWGLEGVEGLGEQSESRKEDYDDENEHNDDEEDVKDWEPSLCCTVM